MSNLSRMEHFESFMHSLAVVLNSSGYSAHDMQMVMKYFWSRLKAKYQANWDECMFEVDLEDALRNEKNSFFRMIWAALDVKEQRLWLYESEHFTDTQIAFILNSL